MFSEILDTHTIKVYDADGCFTPSYFYKKNGQIWLRNVQLGEYVHPTFGNDGAKFDEWLSGMIKNYKFSIELKRTENKA